jgi:hypothetical protein
MDIKEWAELAKIVGVIGAGIWGFLLLFILRKTAIAQADLLYKQAQIRDLDAKLKGRVVLSIEIEASVRREPGSDKYTVLSIVNLVNKGDRLTRVAYDYRIEPFAVYRSVPQSDGHFELKRITGFHVMQTRYPATKVVSHAIRGNSIESIPFLFQLAEPGAYLLAFAVPVSEEDRKEAEAAGLHLPSVWAGRKYLFVDDDALAKDANTAVANLLAHPGTGEVEEEG